MTTESLPNLKKWAENRQLLAILFAREVAVAADACFGTLKMLRTNESADYLPLISNVNKWLPLYKRRWGITKQILDRLAPPVPGEPSLSDIVRTLARQWNATLKFTPDDRLKLINECDPAQIKEIHDNIVGFLQELMQAQNKQIELERTQASTAEDDESRQLLWNSMEFQFLWRVWSQCLLLQGDYPARIYYRARHGDLNSLEFLLRADKSVIHDRLIAGQIFEASQMKNRARFNRLMQALRGTPQKLGKSTVKSRLASLISIMLAGLQQRIDAPVVGQLFDAMQKDLKRGMKDHDLPVGETLAKRIQRYRGFWRIMDKTWPDKNSPPTCPGKPR